ncbi:hypothetical protein B0T25DRAFT_95924 [Lasiosphaeria hispida]|uniref:Uncharacterized protein n=1 Tax=Lasiosphaeria hispida TaxID=260671 RepID=A0AAJ0HQI0_9PEZI|nr:hypothetical protein B0T25DRAFT_95924 [Lasiosphaeria hispida]
MRPMPQSRQIEDHIGTCRIRKLAKPGKIWASIAYSLDRSRGSGRAISSFLVQVAQFAQELFFVLRLAASRGISDIHDDHRPNRARAQPVFPGRPVTTMIRDLNASSSLLFELGTAQPCSRDEERRRRGGWREKERAKQRKSPLQMPLCPPISSQDVLAPPACRLCSTTLPALPPLANVAARLALGPGPPLTLHRPKAGWNPRGLVPALPKP